MKENFGGAVPAALIREMDRVAIEEYGMPGIALMENAGAGAAGVVLSILPAAPSGVAVLAGRGNNGGDAFVVARHLRNRSIPVEVYFAGDLESVSAESDAGINLFILLKSGQRIIEIFDRAGAEAFARRLDRMDAVVDGLLGTGTRGEIKEPYSSIIDAVNGSGRKVVSIDLPSGLDPDTGLILGKCISADCTATFVRPKTGFFLESGPEMCGTIHVIDIGMPIEAIRQALRQEGERGEAGT